jgi:hypothetical protein
MSLTHETIAWNCHEAPYIRGSLVPPDLTDAQRLWVAERLEIHAGLFPDYPEDITPEYVAELIEHARTRQEQP